MQYFNYMYIYNLFIDIKHEFVSAALCFSELQIFVRRAGCEYGYLHKAFGPLPAFIYTWMRIGAAEPCTTAVFAKAFASYIADLIGDDCGPPAILHKLLAILAISKLFKSQYHVLNTLFHVMLRWCL